ncbi:hypothetical protein Pdw03_7902 [Penicillium digitatum]|uniref:Uncharacterized protein n=1 Tax=Penicillium digitatum TaxID=36651 RepID=A0A7T7BLK4_PENDI|nr:hypothetical protein Pdw03_7902 [Penicillium digitatum]
MHGNNTPGSKIHSLDGLLPTPNYRTRNRPLLENHRRWERRRNSLGVIFRNAHTDHRATETQQRQCLRICRIHSSTDNCSELRFVHEKIRPRFLD